MSIVSPRAGAHVPADWKMPEGMKGVLFLIEEMKAAGSWHIPTLDRLAELVENLARHASRQSGG